MNVSANTPHIEYFYHWEKTTPDAIFLKQPFGAFYKDFTFAEAGRQARIMATYLNSIGLPPSSHVAIISKNCAEWFIADLAIIMSGHVSVPTYATLTADQLNQVLVHSDSKVGFVGKLDGYNAMKAGLPADMKCISFPEYNPDPSHVQWNDILASHEPMKGDHSPKLDDLWTIKYTSGTTGNPKGVMLSYKNVAECIDKTSHMTFVKESGNKFFSYLPLSHIAERNIVETVSIISGGTVYFADTLESFAKNLADASPTHFLAVPRIWTKFHLGILAKMPQKKLDLFLKIPILNSIVKKKIRTGLGLSTAKILLTGAAPMPESLIRWYRKLGIVIQEAYGMTENAGAVTMMPTSKIKDGSVGKIYPGMEVKLDSVTGEILTKSEWNMVGYYKEPKMTAETIDEAGWLHTGDVGVVDADGYLKITGRVKEMYKTSKGEYVAPAQLEFGFADNNNIEQICVVGQSIPQPIALVVLSEMGAALEESELMESLKQTLKSVNSVCKSHERIETMVIMKEPWNVENNKLTPTFKIKRNIIEKEFEANFENWYEAKEKVIRQG